MAAEEPVIRLTPAGGGRAGGGEAILARLRKTLAAAVALRRAALPGIAEAVDAHQRLSPAARVQEAARSGAAAHGRAKPGTGAGHVLRRAAGSEQRERESEREEARTRHAQKSSGAGSSFTCHGKPCVFSMSMKGSGSSCSILNTPAPDQMPCTISAAPIIAGTPVV